MKQVILLIMIGILVGCAPKTVQEEAFPPKMQAFLSIDEEKYRLLAGDYYWERKTGLGYEVSQTDHASPYETAQNMTPIVVKPGEQAAIHLEENPIIQLYIWSEKGRTQEVSLTDQTFTFPPKAGSYIYEAFAQWTNGTISYTFVVDIQ